MNFDDVLKQLRASVNWSQLALLSVRGGIVELQAALFDWVTAD